MPRIETNAIHEGIEIDNTFNSVTTPIYTSSTFTLTDLGKTKAGFDYTRSGNPTRKALEDNLALLENGKMAAATSSGMSAIMAVLSLLSAGDHLIAPLDIYGGTYRLFSLIAPKFGIEVSFLQNPNDLAELKAELKPNTKMLWIESPSNPLLKLTDIKAVCNESKSEKNDLIIVADNTFMSPYFQNPLDLGCDIIIHSTTKYINGHSDLVGGIVICKTEELGEKIAQIVNCMGLAESPFDAWLALRGVKTLSIRMQAHEKNALQVCEFLNNHEAVQKVYYPGLSSPEQFELAKQQMRGFGGMLSFELKPEKYDINVFFSKLKYFKLAVSLGGVESLIAQPWSMSHASMNEEARLKAGITPNLIRLSVGIENVDDLIADLDSAFQNCCC